MPLVDPAAPPVRVRVRVRVKVRVRVRGWDWVLGLDRAAPLVVAAQG